MDFGEETEKNLCKIKAEFEAEQVMKINEKSIWEQSYNFLEIASKIHRLRKVPNAK